MFPHMPTALLQNCPELSQPEPLGTSFMPHSGMKIGKAANKASDRTSVVGIFLTCAKKTISPGKHSRDRIPACTEGIQNKWTKKIFLAIRKKEDLQDLQQVLQLHFEMGHGSLTSLTGTKPAYPSSLPTTILLKVIWQKPKQAQTVREVQAEITKY